MNYKNGYQKMKMVIRKGAVTVEVVAAVVMIGLLVYVYNLLVQLEEVKVIERVKEDKEK